jgi:hypothetical protein
LFEEIGEVEIRVLTSNHSLISNLAVHHVGLTDRGKHSIAKPVSVLGDLQLNPEAGWSLTHISFRYYLICFQQQFMPNITPNLLQLNPIVPPKYPSSMQNTILLPFAKPEASRYIGAPFSSVGSPNPPRNQIPANTSLASRPESALLT